MMRAAPALAALALCAAVADGATVTMTKYKDPQCRDSYMDTAANPPVSRSGRFTQCGQDDADIKPDGSCRDTANQAIDDTYTIPPVDVSSRSGVCTAVSGANGMLGLPTSTTLYTIILCDPYGWNATFFSDSTCATAIPAATINGAIAANKTSYYNTYHGTNSVTGVSSSFANLLATGGATSGLCLQYSTATGFDQAVMVSFLQNLPASGGYTYAISNVLIATATAVAQQTLIPLHDYGYYKITWDCTVTPAPSPSASPPAPADTGSGAAAAVVSTAGAVATAAALLL
jgi:hypothetical protein